MKTRILIISLAFLFGSFFSRFVRADEWSRADQERQAVYLVLHAIDWGQTVDLAHRPEYFEVDLIGRPIMGDHPKVSSVNAYMIGTAAVMTIIADRLPSEWRETFQMFIIADAAMTVRSNYLIGLNVRFW